jgi:hypothetical protein
LFEAGHSTVIVDACHITKHRRDRWRSTQWGVSYKFFFTSPEECIRRAVDGGKDYLVSVIKGMARTEDFMMETNTKSN